VKNTKDKKVWVEITENISKEIIENLSPYLDEIYNLTTEAELDKMIEACNNSYECIVDAIVKSKRCDDCSKKIDNSTYVQQCEQRCVKPSVLFSPLPTKIVSLDPVVVWKLELKPGEVEEVSYEVNKNVEQVSFEDPILTTYEEEPKEEVVENVTNETKEENITIENETVEEVNITEQMNETKGPNYEGIVMGFLIVFLLFVLIISIGVIIIVVMYRNIIIDVLTGKRGIVIKYGGKEHRIRLGKPK